MAQQISAENVIGRDKIIRQLWRRLETESVVFTAERRIGKTTVLTKMSQQPLADKLVIYSDLEKVGSPKQFVEVILTSISQHLSKGQAAANWVEKWLPALGGIEVGGMIKLPEIEGRGWQSLLEKTLNHVCQNQTTRQIIFLWDEIPYMLQKINQAESNAASSENSALAILDTLRAMRHEHHNLRMIFTGSIGLHHVLNTLRNDKLAAQPVNDMAAIPIGPLAAKHAKTLAAHLLTAEDIDCEDSDAVITCLIRLTDAVPFYMQRVVAKLALIDGAVTVADVETEIKQHLVAAHDPWEMAHFRTRLNIYYPDTLTDVDGKRLSHAKLAKLLLNHLALADTAQSINQCFTVLKTRVRIDQRDIAITLLDLLARDHYLARDELGHYYFCFALLKRWWVLAEGLEKDGLEAEQFGIVGANQ